MCNQVKTTGVRTNCNLLWVSLNLFNFLKKFLTVKHWIPLIATCVKLACVAWSYGILGRAEGGRRRKVRHPPSLPKIPYGQATQASVKSENLAKFLVLRKCPSTREINWAEATTPPPPPPPPCKKKSTNLKIDQWKNPPSPSSLPFTDALHKSQPRTIIIYIKIFLCIGMTVLKSFFLKKVSIDHTQTTVSNELFRIST